MNSCHIPDSSSRNGSRSYLEDRPGDDFVRSVGREWGRAVSGVEGDFEGLPVPIGSRADGTTRTGLDE